MQRKLTAILSADVVGYSGLMEIDESGTLERLKANRSEIFDPQVASHGGRLFKLMGDGALVEFSSVIAAVNCALAIQNATAQAAPELAEDARIRYRIGINLGEVIVEGEDIYGEGVNVAARLQTLAPAGGVALSRIVRDQVEGKAPCVFEDMGEHTVKNIERPVHVFSVRNAHRDEIRERKVEEIRRLSICVLPFANMSGDAEQEYFSDGISEDIITDLSKVSALFVISRNSAFTFKGRNVDVPKVARELKVSHVLEGSVRKAGGRVRITAQLIDGKTNGHVWAERYDRDLTDVFAIQDEISEAIVAALKLQLLPEEKEAIERRGTSNIDAYNLYLMARHIFLAGNVASARASDEIVRLCKGAVKIDPGYAHAWATMSLALTIRSAMTGGPTDEGLAAAERTIALDPSLAEAHAAKARILANRMDFQGARSELAEALRLDPDSFEANIMAGIVCVNGQRFQDSISYFERAARTAEKNFTPFGLLMGAHLTLGDEARARQYAELTIARAQSALAQEPDNGAAMGYMALSLAVLGETERAREIAARGQLLDPDNEIMKMSFMRTFVRLGDADSVLALFEGLMKNAGRLLAANIPAMRDMDFVRETPRFKAAVAAAEARLAT